MIVCTYCKTESQDDKICDYCKADLIQPRPKLNDSLSELDALQTQPELQKLHTYDLLRILSHIRAIRSNWYKNMQIVRKAPREAQIDAETVDYAIDEYKQLNARKNVIEQLLVDRMGYFPKRIDNKLLGALKYKIEKCEYETSSKKHCNKNH